MNSLLTKMSPKAKQLSAIALAATALLGGIVLTIGTDSGGPEERWNPKTDKQVNVITNDNNKNMGLDAMAGRIKYLDSQNRQLKERVDRLVKERQSDKADTSLEQAWKERFDALSGEVNKLRAQQRDVNVRMNSQRNTAPATADGKQTIDDPFEVREQKRREILGDELGQSIQGSVKPQGKGTPSGGTGFRTAKGSGTLHINVVSDPEVPEDDDQPAAVTPQPDQRSYIPAGAILTGTLITGADFPTGNKSRENPTPAIVRLSKSAILPNRFKSDVRECFLLVSGHGDLATERATLRSETLSCIRTDGGVIQTKLSGYVSGEDGKAGLKGRLVSKTGQMIARTMVAGFLSGVSQAFDYDPVEVLSTSPTNNVQYQNKWSSDAAKSGLAQGMTQSLDRVAEFYMNLAEQMTPVVEVTAGRQVDLVVISGTYLDVMSGTKNTGSSNDPTIKPTQAPRG